MEKQPWDNETAAEYIHQLARSDALALHKKRHAGQRMSERGILAGDILYVLKYGEVFGTAEQSTRDGFFKYKIQSKTPNSDGEIIRVVVIPCLEKVCINMITVMLVKS